MPLQTRLFARGPRISKENGTLVASTGWGTRLLTLGLFVRHVTVDPARKRIDIRSRYLWFMTRRRTIRFSEVKAVTYGYEDASIHAPWQWTHDAWDRFRVGLRLHDLEEIDLFTFSGLGGFVNDSPFPDWCYWEEFAFDAQGTQENESRTFVDLLSGMLRVTVIPPAY